MLLLTTSASSRRSPPSQGQVRAAPAGLQLRDSLLLKGKAVILSQNWMDLKGKQVEENPLRQQGKASLEDPGRHPLQDLRVGDRGPDGKDQKPPQRKRLCTSATPMGTSGMPRRWTSGSGRSRWATRTLQVPHPMLRKPQHQDSLFLPEGDTRIDRSHQFLQGIHLLQLEERRLHPKRSLRGQWCIWDKWHDTM